jgi:hypothetical protein
MPGLDPNITLDLLNELEWLRQLAWKTTAARTKDWKNRPRNQVVINTLSSAAAKGYAIRSGLCAVSFLAEKEVEKAFAELIHKLASSYPADTYVQAKVLENWKEEVGRILRRNIEQVVDLTTAGSPLRRREARQKVNEAILKQYGR